MVKLEEPDKGQAWVVAIAACLISTILAGLTRVRGLLYVSIIEIYGVSRQDAAEPFAIQSAFRCLGGPIVGIIGQRYGVKAVTFWGGVIASLGAILSCIAPNVFWLAVFWGGLYGFGHALASTLFIILINQYFVKYKATASGIAISGGSIGSFVLAFITKAVLDAFGLSGCFLILGGIALHTLPASLLLKSPQWIENPEQYARLKALKLKQHTSEILETRMPDSSIEEGRKLHLQQCPDLNRPSSLDECPAEKCKPSSSLKEKTGNFNVKNFWKMKRQKSCNGSTIPAEKPPIIPILTISGDLEKKHNRTNSSAPCEKTPKLSSVKKTLLESFRGIPILYTNPLFLLINASMLICTFIFVPVFTVVVDYGNDKGIAESYGTYLINSIGVGDLIGRLCFGWVTDKKILSIPVYMAMCFLLKGVFVLLFPLVTDLYFFMLLLALYGMTVGTTFTHSPLLILRYVDMNLQYVAIGYEVFLSGLAVFAVPWIVGYFRDDVGSYDVMFYLMGTMSLVSGCLWFLIPPLVEFQRKKAEQNKILHEEGTAL